MARILLIYIDINTGFFPGLHHGLASLAASVRQGGHLLKFYHLTSEDSPEALAEEAARFSPQLIGFSVTTNQRRYLEKYSAAIYQKTKTPQVVGGVHASVDPMDVFKIGSIQGVGIGEAERTLPGLLNKIDTGEPIMEAAGFWWREQGGLIRHNAVPALEPDLSSLPYPDYSIFDIKNINAANAGWMDMMVTRGCPYDCSYCCNHVLRSIYPSPKDYVRVSNAGHAVNIIKNNLRVYPGIKGITFSDDLLMLNEAWFKDFADRYRREVNLPFICNARVEHLTEGVCASLKKAGCILVRIGLESGNQWLRSYILNRKMSNAQILDAFRITKKYKIPRFSYNIIGFPFETKEFMKETLALNKRIKPDMGHAYYFFPYPGTKLYSLCKEFGLLNNDEGELSGYLEHPAIRLTHCKISDCKKIYNKLRLYLLSCAITKAFKFLPDFSAQWVYFTLNLHPQFFVDLFTKRSKLKSVMRKAAYKKMLQV